MYGVNPDVDGLTLALANGADYVLLVNPDGNVISKVAWGNAKSNWSLSTTEDTTLERCAATRERFSRLDWLSGRTATPGSIPAECQ